MHVAAGDGRPIPPVARNFGRPGLVAHRACFYGTNSPALRRASCWSPRKHWEHFWPALQSLACPSDEPLRLPWGIASCSLSQYCGLRVALPDFAAKKAQNSASRRTSSAAVPAATRRGILPASWPATCPRSFAIGPLWRENWQEVSFLHPASSKDPLRSCSISQDRFPPRPYWQVPANGASALFHPKP